MRRFDTLTMRRVDWGLVGFIQVYPDRWRERDARQDVWRVRDVDAKAWAGNHPTREAAEAALIAAQPVPAAVVRVRS